MKRIISGFLSLVLLSVALSAAAGGGSPFSAQPSQGLVTAEDPLSSPSSTVYAYTLGADELLSIPAVVGDRECTEMTQGQMEQDYSYNSATVRDDLLAYINYLGEMGFEVVRGASLSEPGEGELAAVSDAGARTSILLDWTLSGYRIRLSKSGPAAQAEEQPANTEAPQIPVAQSLTNGPSRLMNYEEWLLQYVDVIPIQGDFMDQTIHVEDWGNGWVEDGVEYPRAWPAQWLDGVIPAYAGTGWMFDAYAIHPSMSYAAEDVKHVAVTVYDYVPAEMDAYIAGLSAYGLTEISDDASYSGSWIEEKRTFSGNNCMFNILFANGRGPSFYISTDSSDPEAPVPFVQFNVDFFDAPYASGMSHTDFLRNPYVLDTSVTGNTELLNYNQFSALMGWEEDVQPRADVLVESETDAYGRLNEVIYYPSVWPKDVFGNLIPEYRSFGMMHYMVVTTPAANPSRDQTLIASMYIAAFDAADVERYARELAAYGYREVPPEEYTEQEKQSIAEAELDACHIFLLPNMRCVVQTYEEEGLNMLQINLRWDGRYNNFFNQ